MNFCILSFGGKNIMEEALHQKQERFFCFTCVCSFFQEDLHLQEFGEATLLLFFPLSKIIDSIAFSSEKKGFIMLCHSVRCF